MPRLLCPVDTLSLFKQMLIYLIVALVPVSFILWTIFPCSNKCWSNLLLSRFLSSLSYWQFVLVQTNVDLTYCCLGSILIFYGQYFLVQTNVDLTNCCLGSCLLCTMDISFCSNICWSNLLLPRFWSHFSMDTLSSFIQILI